MTRDDFGLRLGVFFILSVGLWLFIPVLLHGTDRMLATVLASLVAGMAANFACAYFFEQGQMRDFGLGWDRVSARQLALGFALGIGSVAVLAAGAVVAGLAAFEPVAADSHWPLAPIVLLLLAGALGEELLFRGYPFQYLVREWYPWAAIAGSGALFGLAHLLLNRHIELLGALNTALWGTLLGYAYWRSRTLWLPAGIHFGWNLGLVLIGVPLSGLTIKAAGFGLHWSASAFVSGGEYGPEGGVLTSVLGVGLFLVLKRVRSRP